MTEAGANLFIQMDQARMVIKLVLLWVAKKSVSD